MSFKNRFDDIDLSKFTEFMESMSEEQKQKLQEMTIEFMQNNPGFTPDAFEELNRNFYDQNSGRKEEEQAGFIEGLYLSQNDIDLLDEKTLDLLDEAWQIEEFLEGDIESDYSPALLLYLKAVLSLLRSTYRKEKIINTFAHVPTEHESTIRLLMEAPGFPDYQSLSDFADLLKLYPEISWAGNGGEMLRQWALLLIRAENDWIDQSELQYFKDQLLTSGFLQSLARMKNE